jgi:DNA-binding beta-propeller fold protein YncE
MDTPGRETKNKAAANSIQLTTTLPDIVCFIGDKPPPFRLFGICGNYTNIVHPRQVPSHHAKHLFCLPLLQLCIIKLSIKCQHALSDYTNVELYKGVPAMHIMPSKKIAILVILTITGACIALLTYTSVEWRSENDVDGAVILEPADIAVGPAGTIYVADILQSYIQKFSADGTFISKWRYPADSERGNTFRPTALAIARGENIYATDYLNNRVQKFDSTGNLLTTWGSAGTADGEFDYPTGIALDARGRVFVADTGNNRVQIFDENGNFIDAWGSAGTSPGDLSGPFDLAVDSRGHVFVADTYNHRIQKFDADGTFLTEWGSKGTGEGQFNGPGGIWVDHRDYVFVADTQNNRMQKFDNRGRFITAWASLGEEQGNLFGPAAVTVDAFGNVYVADAKNYRVQKYRPSFVAQPDDDGENLCEIWEGTWDAVYGDGLTVVWVLEDAMVRDSNFFPCVVSGTSSRAGVEDVPFKIYSFQGKKFMYTEEVGELDQQMPYTFLNVSGETFTAEAGGAYDIASGQKRSGN